MTIYLSGPITGKAAAAADFEQLAQEVDYLECRTRPVDVGDDAS
nr:MAG TPA: Nucleoside 2-deoxyribosyltransferase like protein [Caudoviricetes sp.]